MNFITLDDARAACWELPPTRMKSRRSHVIPLAHMARQLVLAELAKPRSSELSLAAGLPGEWAATVFHLR